MDDADDVDDNDYNNEEIENIITEAIDSVLTDQIYVIVYPFKPA